MTDRSDWPFGLIFDITDYVLHCADSKGKLIFSIGLPTMNIGDEYTIGLDKNKQPAIRICKYDDEGYEICTSNYKSIADFMKDIFVFLPVYGEKQND